MSRNHNVAISALARYAADPASINAKVNRQAVAYGDRAHRSLGAKRSKRGALAVLLVLAAAAAAYYFGAI